MPPEVNYKAAFRLNGAVFSSNVPIQKNAYFTDFARLGFLSALPLANCAIIRQKLGLVSGCRLTTVAVLGRDRL